MIISHKYKFILVTPPKVGSTSLHIFFSQKPFCDQLFINNQQHRMNVPIEYIDKYEIITCWRHPLDREVSLWAHSQTREGKYYEKHKGFSFEHFVKVWQPNATPFYKDSQSKWLGVIKPTTVIRFNHIKEDVLQLRPIIEAINNGYNLIPLKKLNISIHPHWRRCYTKELQDIVIKRFEDDIYD